MASQNQSIFLGNVLVEDCQIIGSSDFYSIFHNDVTVTANLFQIIQILLALCLTYQKSVFPLFLFLHNSFSIIQVMGLNDDKS